MSCAKAKIGIQERPNFHPNLYYFVDNVLYFSQGDYDLKRKIN